MTVDPLTTECLLGTVGLTPKEITPRQHTAAATLPDTFRDRALAWWNRRDRKRYKDIREIDLDKLFDKIAAPPTQGELEDWLSVAGDDDEVIQDLHLSLSAAREYLKEKWPRIQIRTFAGTRLAALSVDDAAEVTSLIAVLNEPTRVLDEMDCGSLSPSQAEAFRKIYPTLYGVYRQAIEEGAGKKVTENQDWAPDESEEIALAILTGQPSGLLPYESDQEAPGAPKPEKDLGAAEARTQADQSSKPIGVK